MKFILKHFGKTLYEQDLEESKEYLLGRGEGCDFLLEDSQLSRKHIKIYQAEETGVWMIECLSSGKGLYKEGEELSSYEITESCELNLKNYVLKFESDQAQIEDELQEMQEDIPSKKETLQEQKTNTKSSVLGPNEETKLVSSSHLVYSLHAFIEGEFSDHISLSGGESWVLGRAEECDICIDYSLLTRKHIQILKKEQGFYIKDLGSSNKTKLNGKDLIPHKEVPLHANDKISVAELTLTFEARNINYENAVKNLPELATVSKENPDFLPALASPKIVLEDFVEESDSPAPAKKTKIIRLALVAVIVCGTLGYVYYEYEAKKEKEKTVDLEKQEKAKKIQLTILYQEAQKSLREGRYLDCISQVKELEKTADASFYQDSQKLLMECETGKDYAQMKKHEEEEEKRRLEIEQKVDKIVKHCQAEYDKKAIKTLEDLNECAKELIDLQPDNPVISNLRSLIEDEALKKQMEAQKKEEYKKWINSKKALYYKAKKISEQNKPLKAVSAYNVFLKSARGVAGLKALAKTAEQERDQIQKGYDDKLSALYLACETLIKNKKFKEAFFNCSRIEEIIGYDEKARNHQNTAKLALRNELRPLYEQSQWHESFSRIEEAQKLWQEIMARDIRGGYYYQKASSQIKKYDKTF